MSVHTSRDKQLVYGDSGSGFLVFMQRDLADLYAILASSKTWGELATLLPAAEYEETIERAFDLDETGARPQPEDAFCLYDVHDYSTSSWPSWPIQEMLDWMAADIQRQYGKVDMTMFDGDQLIIDPEREAEVVQALEKQGYLCIKDVGLAELSVGNYPSTDYKQKWAWPD